jgi:hypothetical protein
VRRALADEAAKLKNKPGEDIMIYGSGSIVRAVSRLGLIDEYRLGAAARPKTLRPTPRPPTRPQPGALAAHCDVAEPI